MSVTYGFYNSQNGDRKYSAEDISRVFDGLITDGIFLGYGDALEVTTDETAMQVKVGSGRAWFNHTWTHNDTALYLDIDKPTSSLQKRIDTIVVEVNPNTRTNDIKVIKGEVSSSGSPVAPTLTHGENGTSYQYPLANITVTGADDVILKSAVANRRGVDADGTPFVTSVVQSVSVDDLVAQWQGSFDEWFETIKGILDGDAAGNLANRVVELENTHYAAQHRNIYRGKNLGTSITNAQKEAIKNGTFDDIYIGDYWILKDHKWLVADMDYMSHNYHHLVLIPDEPLYEHQGSSVLDTRTGYPVSSLHSSLVSNELLPAERRMFYDYLIDSVDDTGRPRSGSWHSMLTAVVPSEIMVYGTRIWSYGNDGSEDIHLFTNDTTQLALFRLAPRHIFCNSRYWLRDVVSKTQFAVVLERNELRGNGTANRAKVTSSYGVRPIIVVDGNANLFT